MRKGIHPALQIMKIVSPDGRLWEVLTPRIYKNEHRFRSLAQEEEAKEREGQLARFRRRYGDSYDDSEAAAADEPPARRAPTKRPWRDGASGKSSFSADADKDAA
jgi:ribosomal protein L31